MHDHATPTSSASGARDIAPAGASLRASNAAPHSGTPTARVGRKRRSATQPIDLSRIAAREALPLTLRELARLYTAQHPDERDMEMHLRKWLDDFSLAERLAWSITTEELVHGVEAMGTMGYAQGTINRDLSSLGTLYRYAQDEKLCPASFVSPTLAIRRKACNIRYVPPAGPGEWEGMRRAARLGGDQLFTAFVWLIMDTAARRGEITERRWDEFQLDSPDGPHIELLDTKTDRPRRIYFGQETAALLRRLRPAERYRHELAFKGRNGAPRKFQQAWERYRERIGRPELHVHDLRHMVAAELLKKGKGMSQVSSMLGHSTLVLHTRYGHLDDAAVREMQAERLSLDARAAEWAPVAEAKRRQAEREANAPAQAAAEAQRLALVAQEAAQAALSAAQALASMRGGAALPNLGMSGAQA